MIIIHKREEIENKYSRIDNDQSTIKDISNYTLVNFHFLEKHIKEIINKDLKVALELFSDESFELIEKNLSTFSMIQINFRTFKDGRPFSFAKKLRKQLNFTNEIRAGGHILPDQYIFLLRSGFDSVEINKEDKEIWIEILDLDDGLYYQPD